MRRLALAFGGAILIYLVLLAIIWVAVMSARTARAEEAWPLNPTGDRHISEWFQGLMQPDNPSLSCCGKADAFEADNFEIDGDHYVAIITDGFGVYAPGTRVPVPNQKMKWDRGNPTGHGVLFLQVGTKNVYCYVAPSGV